MRARLDARSERFEGLLSPRRPAALPLHMALADMDAHRPAVASDAVFDQPVRGRGRHVRSVPGPLLLALQPSPRLLQLLDLDTFQEPEKLQTGRQTFVHMFESRSGATRPPWVGQPYEGLARSR